MNKTETNSTTPTCLSPAAKPYTNGFGYWYLTVKQARLDAEARAATSKEGAPVRPSRTRREPPE